MRRSNLNDDWKGGYFKFPEEEMRCKCGCGGLPKHSFMLKLVALRIKLGFPMEISSGYRCANHNEAVSSTGRLGPHVLGLASDVKVDRQKAYDLVKEAMILGFTGIGVNQKGEGRYIHLDTVPEDQRLIPRRTIWSY